MNTYAGRLRTGLAASAIAMAMVVLVPVVGSTPLTASAQPTVGSTAVSAERQAARRAQHPSVGVVDHALWGDRTMAKRRTIFSKLRNIRARWVRIGLPWASVQPHRPTRSDSGWSKWGMAKVTRVVRIARRQGLNVSMTLVGTPGWANGGRGDKYLPSDPSTYARAIRRLSHHFRGSVQSWEIWNEANHINYLRGATVAEYKRVLCAAYPAVHRGAPRARVISAGTAGIDTRWIRRLYDLGGKRCFDVLAVHPYVGPRSPHYSWGDNLPVWLQRMHQLRRIMRGHGDLRTNVWFTEMGWSTHANKAAGGVTRRQQAKWLVEQLKMTDHRLPYVKKISVFMSRDERVPDSVQNRNYGLFTYDLQPKPAAGRLRTYLAGVRRR